MCISLQRVCVCVQRAPRPTDPTGTSLLFVWARPGLVQFKFGFGLVGGLGSRSRRGVCDSELNRVVCIFALACVLG